MRIRTQSVVLLLALSSACAGASPAIKSPGHEAGPAADARQLGERQVEQARRIAELEARIALLEADARHVREVAAPEPAFRTGETIRIGPSSANKGAQNGASLTEIASSAAPEHTQPSAAQASAPSSGRVPSYRLYGHAASPSRDSLAPLPVVDETLPVVPLPEQRAKRLPPIAAQDDSDTSTGDYRSALRLLHERHFDEALTALSSFVSHNPNHALVPKAIYWRGEARYAKREYAQALSEFEAVLERFPASDKVPDALLKVALCFRHLGAEDKAQNYFRRLRTTYPNSQAASIASREGST